MPELSGVHNKSFSNEIKHYHTRLSDAKHAEEMR